MIIPSDTPDADLALPGFRLAQTFGTDGNLYVMDTVGKRIMSFDLGLNGGTRGTLLNSFYLDQTKPADNSLTMDFAGNLYVGDGLGGFNMYSKEGQWKMGFSDTYTPDPNIVIPLSGSVRSYMNFYASGLNDGNGTLDIHDSTGYRQYTINASSNTPPTISVAPGGLFPTDTSARLNLVVADIDNSAASLTLSAASSNTQLVPNGNIAFGGTGANRTSTITIVNGRTGTAIVTLTVSDGQASSTTTVTIKVGGNGSDTLTGTDGTDILFGQNGDDTLFGGGGIDLLSGGKGSDRLTGGADADHFNGGAGDDTATDFNQSEGDTQTSIP